MKRVLRLLPVAVAIACGGDSPARPGQPGPAIQGTFQLERIDGSVLPAFRSSTTALEEMLDVELGCSEWTTAGTITIQLGNRYARTETDAYRGCVDPHNNVELMNLTSGTWTLDGSSLSLIEDSQVLTHTAIGVWNADVITLTFIRDLFSDGINVETTRRVYRR